MALFAKLQETAAPAIKALYASRDSDGKVCDVLY